MTPVHLTNLVELAQSRVISQYQALKLRLLPGIGVFVGMAQDLEDQLFALWGAIVLDTATGVWLAYLGRIVGQEKQGLNDTDFRAVIKGRIIANRSTGTWEELIAICRAVLQDPNLDPIILQYTKTSLLLEIPNSTPVDQNETPGDSITTPIHLRTALERLLGKAKAAGMKLMVETHPVGGPNEDLVRTAFTGSSGTAQPEISDLHGLGDSTDPTVGGDISSCNNV